MDVGTGGARVSSRSGVQVASGIDSQEGVDDAFSDPGSDESGSRRGAKRSRKSKRDPQDTDDEDMIMSRRRHYIRSHYLAPYHTENNLFGVHATVTRKGLVSFAAFPSSLVQQFITDPVYSAEALPLFSELVKSVKSQVGAFAQRFTKGIGEIKSRVEAMDQLSQAEVGDANVRLYVCPAWVFHREYEIVFFKRSAFDVRSLGEIVRAQYQSTLFIDWTQEVSFFVSRGANCVESARVRDLRHLVKDDYVQFNVANTEQGAPFLALPPSEPG